MQVVRRRWDMTTQRQLPFFGKAAISDQKIAKMDLLKKEMERKRRALQEAKKRQSDGDRFVKATELRRLQEEQEDMEREKKRKKSQSAQDGSKKQRVQEKKEEEEKKKTKQQVPPTKKDGELEQRGEQKEGSSAAAASSPEDSIAKLSPEEVDRQFRELGLPVRLFGERTDRAKADDSTRLERLREALADRKKALANISEKDDYRLGRGHQIRNPFLDKGRADAPSAEVEPRTSKSPVQQGDDSSQAAKDEKEQSADDLRDDPHKRIYKYFKGLLKEWEHDLDQRPEQVKRSVAGKKETNTMKQCKDYIRPLFTLCKKRQLEDGMTAHLMKIIDCCEEGEFVRAHDAYMDVAIGRAAWPIGVTMVGIHARTGRSKIESQNVAHVMNSELQRKYLTSVKRLMTYVQNKRPDVVPSKKVLT